MFSTTDISKITFKVPAKKDAVDVLVPIKDQWYIIGVVLDVSPADLDSLEKSNNSVEVNLSKMIDKWLHQYAEKATWEVLLKAVEGKTVNSQLTGQKIREFLKIPERSDPCSLSKRGKILYNAFTK